MDNQAKKLETAIKNKNMSDAIKLVEELARKKCPISIHEPEMILKSDFLIYVYIESFKKTHDTPYIFFINKSTKLLDLKEELQKASTIDVDYQYWFHGLTRLNNNDETIYGMVKNFVEGTKLHVYITKMALLDPRALIRRPTFQAWICEHCSNVNNANYIACIVCNEHREPECS